MKCKRTRKMLTDYVNGVLDPEDIILVQEHIAECNSCRQELQMLGKVLNLVEDARVEYPPASVWENFLTDLHRRIESEAFIVFRKQQRQRFYLLPGWIAGTTAVLLILFASVMMRYYPAANPPQIQVAENTEIAENSSEQELVVGLISRVLITEAEAAKLKELRNFTQPETLTAEYHYDEILAETSWEASPTEDDEGFIQFLLDNEFAEFDDNTVVESEIGDLVNM